MTLWDKGQKPDEGVLAFSAGSEYILDLRLVPYDCDASMAHARMLGKIGVLGGDEVNRLEEGLGAIKDLHGQGRFSIKREQEDCHTAIEEWLVEELGQVGQKIHLGRSRNDQVLTALRLYERDALAGVKHRLRDLRAALVRVTERQGSVQMVGYTHMRRAMPTTVGVWLGGFADAIDDLLGLARAVEDLLDQSPLGTAAGYGVPVFELDRAMTAREMGFDRIQSNPVYAQMSRGLFEGAILGILSHGMFLLNRLAADLLLFSTEEFGFVSLPEALCTGSSIMPHKKNPDLLEIVRASYHRLLAAEFEVKSLIGNLMSGYQRDLGLTKEPLFRAFDTTEACVEMMQRIVTEMGIDSEACSAAMSREIYATEEAYKLVRQGVPFREAYRRIGREYSTRPHSSPGTKTPEPTE